MLRLYLVLQPLLLALLRPAGRFSRRLAEVVEAREGVLERWRAVSSRLGEDRVWVHVSSVGELEQARPVIDRLSAQGHHSVVLSYFSASVPKLVKDWSFVRHADYLPFDTPEAMAEMMRLVRPRALVLNRYDLWPNHVLAAKAAGVPVILINASTPPLGWFGRLSLSVRGPLFASVDGWTFVDAAAAAGWEPYINRPARGLVAGDPRVDRVLARARARIAGSQGKGPAGRWRRGAFCLVAGSTWPPDEEVLLDAWPLVQAPKSLVIVPHEPDEAHLGRLQKDLARRGVSYTLLSELSRDPEGGPVEAEALVVDQRGLLAELYGMGDLAYVGGGFGRHVHSIVEPVAHGLLVAFGPRFGRSPEAYTLAAVGAACALPERRKARCLAGWIEEMRDPAAQGRLRAVESLRVFLQVHHGAGDRVADFVESRLSSD